MFSCYIIKVIAFIISNSATQPTYTTPAHRHSLIVFLNTATIAMLVEESPLEENADLLDRPTTGKVCASTFAIVIAIYI